MKALTLLPASCSDFLRLLLKKENANALPHLLHGVLKHRTTGLSTLQLLASLDFDARNDLRDSLGYCVLHLVQLRWYPNPIAHFGWHLQVCTRYCQEFS